MVDTLLNSARNAVSLYVVETSNFSEWSDTQSKGAQNWMASSGFGAKAGQAILIPDSEGSPASAVFGVSNLDDVWALGDAGRKLPAGTYTIRTVLSKTQATNAAVAWALGAYSFDQYKTKSGAKEIGRAHV